MTTWVHRVASVVLASFVLAGLCGIGWRSCLAQEELIDRPGPPPVDDLETDENKDGVPDGWYNARDAKWMAEGGAVGPALRPLRVHAARPAGAAQPCLRRRRPQDRGDRPRPLGPAEQHPGRRARGRRARTDDRLPGRGAPPPQSGESSARGPTRCATAGRGSPSGSRFRPAPGRDHVGRADGRHRHARLRRADRRPDSRRRAKTARTSSSTATSSSAIRPRLPGSPKAMHAGSSPAIGSSAAVELTRAKSRLLTGLALPVDAFQALDVSVAVRCSGLRGAGARRPRFSSSTSSAGRSPGTTAGDYFLSWADSSPWRIDEASVRVPPGAIRAVLQFEKLDSIGSIRIDDVRVTASPNPAAGSWTPYHVADETGEWLPVPPSPSIVAKSALDVSFLLPAPAGARGFVTVKDGRLAFSDGGRARFFGVSLIPPTAFLPRRAGRPPRRPAGPVRHQPGAAGRPRHGVRTESQPVRRHARRHQGVRPRGTRPARPSDRRAQGSRHLRGDRAPEQAAVPQRRRRGRAGLLPAGGGPAAQFDPTIGKLALESARALLGHVNPETGLALRDDPVLAWVTLAGEISLFNLIDSPDALPPPLRQGAASRWRRKARERRADGSGNRSSRPTRKQMADALRKDHLRVPIAGVSHWRREPEFNAAQAAQRAGPDRRPAVLEPPRPGRLPRNARCSGAGQDGGLGGSSPRSNAGPIAPTSSDCGATRPQGAWSYPHEAADHLLGAYTALAGDWDGLVRRGIFLFPVSLGRGAGRYRRRRRHLPDRRGHQRQPPHLRALAARGVAFPPRLSDQARQRPPTGDAPGRGRQGEVPVDLALGPRPRPIAHRHARTRRASPAGSAANRRRCRTWISRPKTRSRSWSPRRSATSRSPRRSGCWSPPSPGSSRPGSAGSTPGSARSPTPAGPRSFRNPSSATVVWRHKGKVRAFVLDNTGARTGEVKLETFPGATASRSRSTARPRLSTGN